MVVVVLGVRFWKLDTLQSEVYGDISIVYEYIHDIVIGHWPFYFSLSSGPLYHYLVFPLVSIAGMNYFGFKLASVLASLAALGFTYLFARRLMESAFAILATFITGISFWFLIFSRLGNIQVIVPLLTMAALWLLLRFIQDHRRADLYACALVASLGLYAYPSAFVLPGTVAVTLLALYTTGFRMKLAEWAWFLVICAVTVMPFIFIVLHDPSNFTNGYLGGKIQAGANAASVLFGNLLRAFGAYHFAGDTVSRSNPLGRPQLDFISGILLLLGLIYWLQRPRRRYGLLLLVPFVLLHIPSILVLSNTSEVPSASRALGVAPIAYVLVAGGLWYFYEFLRRRRGATTAWVASLIMLSLMVSANLVNYFGNYIHNLPYENTPVARQLTQYVDMLPPETQIYLAGCCWEYGMPEPKSVQYEMARPQNLHQIDPNELSCLSMDALLGPAVMIWSDTQELPAPGLSNCANRFPAQLFTGARGQPLFHAATVQGLQLVAAPTGETPSFADGETNGLIEQGVIWNNEVVLARFSPLDIGRIEDAVDGNVDTLMRGSEANPMVIEFEFSQPRAASTLSLTVGTMEHFAVRVVLTYSDRSTTEINKDYTNLPSDPTVEIVLPTSEKLIQTLRIEITDIRATPGEGFHIHVREIKLE